MAWSKYKDRIIAYVNENPGCSKWDIADLCTWNPRRSPSRQYYIVNTALKNKWIVIGGKKGNTYKLYLPDQIPSELAKV